jgi:hypothetical protein
MKNVESKINLEILREEVVHKLIGKKVGEKPIIMVFKLFAVLSLFCIGISYYSVKKGFVLIGDSEPFWTNVFFSVMGWMLIVCFILIIICLIFRINIEKLTDSMYRKYYYNSPRYQPTEDEILTKIQKKCRKKSLSLLQYAIATKEHIKTLEEGIKNSISEADDYIAIGIESEKIDVEQWCQENNWHQNPSTSAKAYDEEIGSLRTQLW